MRLYGYIVEGEKNGIDILEKVTAATCQKKKKNVYSAAAAFI